MSTRTARPYGPAAHGDGVRRFAELTLTLARTEFKVRYFGSALGYLWSLIRPLLLFAVLYLFFVEILHVAKGPNYGVRLLAGIVLWTYFTEATAGCVDCLVNREALLRKIRFPRMVVPVSVSLTAVFNLLLSSVVVLAFALGAGVTPTVRWLEVPLIALGFIVLGTGLGMLLSALYVRFRDAKPIWDVVLQVGFYASPIMYLPYLYNRFAPGFAHIALLSPPATLITQLGHAFVSPTGYSSAIAIAGPVTVAISIALIPAIFLLGWWVFSREAPRVAENL
jgi:ABC-2 type transport system permease protein